MDINVALLLVRSKNFDAMLNFLNPDNEQLYISVVTEAELQSIALQNKWGSNKRSRLDYLLDVLTIIEVHQFHVGAYVEIDAYSQHKNPSFTNYSFHTPRNMGKNDLWIATLGSLLGLQLLTTDADFNHLNSIFLNVRLIAVDELIPFF